MAKFKVVFEGFAYIEAENAEEARDKFDDEEYAFCEWGIDTVEEVDEFLVGW